MRVRSKLKKYFRNLLSCFSSRVSGQKSLCLRRAKQRGNNANVAERFCWKCLVCLQSFSVFCKVTFHNASEMRASEDLTFSLSLCVRSSVRTLRSIACKNDCGEETQLGWLHLLYLQRTKDERPIKNYNRRLKGRTREKIGSTGFKQETDDL